MFKNISVTELNEYLNLIDIRSIEKYNNGHILGSINIPFQQLLIKPDKYLDRSKEYYIYCQKGIQRRKVCQILKNMGYDVINVSGGYEAWVINH